MEFLYSNYPPMKNGYTTFTDRFYSLIPQSTSIDIAVGYVTSDSLIELQKLMEYNPNVRELNLTIGMHYWDKFTKIEYNAARELNDYLQAEKRGEVRLVTPFRFHGKLYTYSNEKGPFAGIIGSNNLSSIIDGGSRIYESSVLLNDRQQAAEMRQFISRLVSTSTYNIRDCDITSFKQNNPLLEDHERVERVETFDFTLDRSVSFEIPIKTEAKSNLNAFFGKGRESRSTGLVKPRHWYEVELIVPKSITSHPAYPKSKSESAVFTVITDDRWKFTCKVSGDYSKNFRSDDDLKILGKWLKGRMEYAGALKVGEPVTEETLKKYGRNSFTFIKTSNPKTWYLDFGVDK